MNSKLTLAAAAALGTLAFAPAANAQTAGLTGFTGGSLFPSFNGTSITLGWTFTANQDITVTSLGLYDVTPNDPFGYDRQVGLWDSTGTLLASVTIPAATPLTTGFRYASSSSVALTSGSQYFLGGLYATTAGADGYISGASSATFDPAITFNGTARSSSSSGFAFPSITTGANGRFGPNFLFTPAVSDVPEPGSVALLVGMMTVGAGVLRRNRRK